jgi:hypothetical protein
VDEVASRSTLGSARGGHNAFPKEAVVLKEIAKQVQLGRWNQCILQRDVSDLQYCGMRRRKPADIRGRLRCGIRAKLVGSPHVATQRAILKAPRL